MGLPLYLALTAPEISTAAALPKELAYMACHFSPYSSGLSNLPQSLPPGSMLILNDSTPPEDHDPQLIAKQLAAAVQQLDCCCILLDFQRTFNELTLQVAAAICSEVSCPVAVSEMYAADLQSDVFLSAPPLDRTLKQWLHPWDGRKIWLDAALDTGIIILDKTGSRITQANSCDPALLPHCSEKFHCHYKIDVSPEQVQFTLQRTEEDLRKLLQEAESLGVTAAVGLYQELGFPF